ncbi:MAG: TRAP transporter small permease subunit [Alphaproteobacteria bacterium]|jgi:TRAP-type mannitol/chloroaromatic compound transport system permease small subunit|nr:TRAP transporter small permease subunit [Alphaproteobacteria bacterium]MBT5161149.1 TRAP transporter small permease subunit [Alphaproteobacteria bacterium]MBT7746640.1 TRAP transporter small permease subunit [Alphaproteobacteria bacterium]
MNGSSLMRSDDQDGRAAVIRIASWTMMAAIAVFLINNILTLGWKLPGAGAVLTGTDPGAAGWGQLSLYFIGLIVAVAFVRRSPRRSLRMDGILISDFNAFVIRAAFWIVLYIGVADMVISFLRVEGLLAAIIGDDLTTQMGRALFRGPVIHLPLMGAAVITAVFTRTLGFTWLALLIVVAELTIVITRFVFSYEQAFMGDLVRFWYAALFLFASAYTLLEDGHVRVDVLYAGFRGRTRGYINAFGSVLLGLSVAWTIMSIGMDGKTGIINGPIVNFEVSQSGFGMYVKYLMAGFLGVFAVTMAIQFVAYFLESAADVREEPGHQDHESSIVA